MQRFFESLRKPKNKFSIENLIYLRNLLLKHDKVTENNKEVVIEALRQLAEVIIWGDQHNPEFFDFFLENNMQAFFTKILKQNTPRDVKVQLLQTLSILIENIGKQESLYYLFSNNYVNELITYKFDFSDDEIIAYYISLLKTLSLKLNPLSVQFFFNEMENDFPLYVEAVKFFSHKDSMIRIAVRTLTLNCYRVEDEAVRRYILGKPAPYFSNLVWFIRSQTKDLENLVNNASYATRYKLEDFAAELLDYLFYIHDIFNLKIDDMSAQLTEHLLQFLFLPQLVGSLSEEALQDRLTPLISVFMLAQVFYIFSHKPLVNVLVSALLLPEHQFQNYSKNLTSMTSTTVSALAKRYSSTLNLTKLESNSVGQSSSSEVIEAPNGGSNGDKAAESNGNHVGSSTNIRSKYYDAILGFLSRDDRVVLASLCLLYSLIKNSALDATLLETAGLTPYRRHKAKRLLAALTSNRFGSAEDTFTPKHSRTSSQNSTGSFNELPTGLNGKIAEIHLNDINMKPKGNSSSENVVALAHFTPSNALTLSQKSTTEEPPNDRVSGSESEKQTAEKTETAPRNPPSETKESESRSSIDYPAESEDLSEKRTESLRDEKSEDQNEDEMTEEKTEDASSDGEAEISRVQSAKIEVIVTPDTNSKESEVTKTEPKDIPQKDSQVKASPTPSQPSSLEYSTKDIEEPSSQQSENPTAEIDSAEAYKINSSLIVEKLLGILHRGEDCRLVTLQMAIILLKELLGQESVPNMSSDHFDMMKKAYYQSVQVVKKCLSGSLRDIFLELFENELRTYKQLNVESLMRDCSTLLLPVSNSSTSGVALPKRLPSTEAEKVQHAIQAFLVMREFVFTILKKRDDRLPLKEPTTVYRVKENIVIEGQSILPTYQVIGKDANKKKLKRYLMLEYNTLVVVEPDLRVSSPKKEGQSLYTICNVVPLQNLQIEEEKSEPFSISLVSHPATWSATLVFEDEFLYTDAKRQLETSKAKVRDDKMGQLEHMLNDQL